MDAGRWCDAYDLRSEGGGRQIDQIGRLGKADGPPGSPIDRDGTIWARCYVRSGSARRCQNKRTSHAAWDVCVTHGSLISDLQSSGERRFGQFQLTSEANPGRLVPGRFACVLSVDKDSPTPMRTPLPAEFAGSE
jgi:hypothetical protein